MALDPQLLEILACPEDKGPLLYFEDEDSLYNPRLKKRYRIQDDIPIMLIDEAETVDDAEHERLMAKGVAPNWEPSRRDRGCRPGVLDTLGMLGLTLGLAEQVEAAAALAAGLDGLPEHDDIENVVVLGMGGSGIAGDCHRRRRAVHARARRRDEELQGPSFASEATLCFAVSFSGNTEETVEAASEAAAAGARMVVLSSGGRLAELADAWGAPWVRLPGDIPMPRAGIGAVSIPPLCVLEQVGLFPGASGWIAEAVAQLRRRRTELERPDNIARELARRIGRTIPLVYGGGALGAVAAARWKNQVNENAKAPAFSNVVSRALPQRDLRLGPARRRHPPGVHARPPAPRPRAPAGAAPLRPRARARRRGRERRPRGAAPRARAPSPSCSTSSSSATSCRCTWPFAEGIDPGPIPVLEDLKRRLAD